MRQKAAAHGGRSADTDLAYRCISYGVNLLDRQAHFLKHAARPIQQYPALRGFFHAAIGAVE